MGLIKGNDGFARSVKNTIDLTSGVEEHTHAPSSIIGLPEYTRNEVGDMVALNSEDGIQVVYNGVTQKLDFAVDALATTSLSDYPVGIQTVVGSMFTGNSTEGISTEYNNDTARIDVSVSDFDVILQGDISGTATVTDFDSNIVINTSVDIATGLTIRDDGVDLGTQKSVDTLSFDGNNLNVTRLGDTVNITVSDGLSSQDVRDEIGTSVKGTVRDPSTQIETETGITVNYDSTNNAVELGVREFDISLTGDITGTGTVSQLNDVNIVTYTNFIEGLTVSDDGVTLGTDESITALNFEGNNLDVTRLGDTINVSVPSGLSSQDVRDEIGTSVKGTVRDPSTQIETETGITVNYDSTNNAIELGVREFDISLTGDITGTGTVSQLNDVNIVTYTNFIEGLTARKDSLAVSDAESIRVLNFVGDNITTALDPTNDTVLDISVTSDVTETDVVDIIKPKLVGNHDGLVVEYDHINQGFNLAVDPITINLNGAVTGTGTVTFDGTSVDSQIDITTNLGGGTAEITVSDEGTTSGNVTSLNFVGGGISTAVSLDGQVATVYVPNSPANETFLTADQGSDNIPNARRLVAGSGISINDGGGSGNFTISANSDAILAKSQIAKDAQLVGQQIEINFNSSRFIAPIVENDEVNGRINITMYDIRELWYTQPEHDCGSLSDNEGPILDMGRLVSGILETKPDLGNI